MDIEVGGEAAGRLVFEVWQCTALLLLLPSIVPVKALQQSYTHGIAPSLPLKLFAQTLPRTSINFAELCTGSHQSRENPGR